MILGNHIFTRSRLCHSRALTTDRANMIGKDTLGDLLCLTQVILGGGAKTNRTSLEQVIPRREILYVGGRYTNITASLIPCYLKCI